VKLVNKCKETWISIVCKPSLKYESSNSERYEYMFYMNMNYMFGLQAWGSEICVSCDYAIKEKSPKDKKTGNK